MSKIDEMIAELCPDGVEYKRLGDIGTQSPFARWGWNPAPRPV